MTIYLCVAGHGRRPNGTFDSGATGLISKGEHRYFAEDFFPAMKKYANDQFVFYTEKNVLAHNSIKSLAGKYKDVKYIEFHYDATSTPNAHGGHVIIHRDYAPDAIDLQLRDAISDMVGVRYEHRGHKGISGRSDLGNVIRSKTYGINYRLLELGFGTSPRDSKIMTEQTDAYAKRIVEALIGEKTKPVKKPTTTKPKPKPKPKAKTIAEVAQEVIAGKWGNNPSRADKLNSAYREGRIAGNASQVQSEVNRILGGKKTNRLSNEEVARQIIRGQGNWGNGQTRKTRLESKGYNYRAVQNIINKLL